MDRETDGQTDRWTDSSENMTYPHVRMVTRIHPIQFYGINENYVPTMTLHGILYCEP